jgi:hypothetical protein
METSAGVAAEHGPRGTQKHDLEDLDGFAVGLVVGDDAREPLRAGEGVQGLVRHRPHVAVLDAEGPLAKGNSEPRRPAFYVGRAVNKGAGAHDISSSNRF